MPVAEPSGGYDLLCAVDLSPLYGKIEEKHSIVITQPPADILDRRLAELESENPVVRSTAVRDLAYFEGQGPRVFPALAACLDDPSEAVATSAIYSLYYYPEQIKANPACFLKVLRNREKPQQVRNRAAYYLGRFAPKNAQIEKALKKAVEALEDPSSNGTLVYALKQYRDRMNEKSED